MSELLSTVACAARVGQSGIFNAGNLQFALSTLALEQKIDDQTGNDGGFMKLKVVIHESEEGGYWAEVPNISGCVTQGDSFDKLLSNLYEAVEGCLSVNVQDIDISEKDKVMEIAI